MTDASTPVIHMDVMAATAIPANAALGHPAHRKPPMQEQLAIGMTYGLDFRQSLRDFRSDSILPPLTGEVLG